MTKQSHIHTIVCCLVVLLLGGSVRAEEHTLVIWSHWGEEPIKVNFMNAVAEEFRNRHGIAVEIVWLPKNVLKEKLVFALDAAELDLTYLDHSFTHPRICRSLLDLSELQFIGEVDPSWHLYSLGDGNNNFLPIEGVSNAIYYHKDLFARANIVLPHDRGITAEEFLDIIRRLRAEGLTPIGEGSTDRTTKIGIPIINTLFRYAGPDKVHQLQQGKLTFSDPDVRAALDFWKDVVDLQGYASNVLQLNFLEGLFEVVEGRAAISFCGTYFYSKYGTTEKDQGQIGVLDWFTVENGKGNAYYEILWAAGFGINRRSAHLEEAKLFLEYLMTPEAASLWVQHVQAPYPVMAEDVSPDSLHGMLVSQRKGQQPAPYPFTYEAFASKAAHQMWEEETRKFVAGERTVNQFIERMNSRLP